MVVFQREDVVAERRCTSNRVSLSGELAHLLEPTHNDRFRRIMDRYLPQWPHVRDELNRAPLGHLDWDY
ncbi:MAG: YgjP-like metallopeptidase domain-containing protein [Byssovorax sp.]